MRVYERSGVTVDQCTECRGIFLDRGELEKLFEAEANWNSQQSPPAGARPAAAPPQPGYAPPPPPPPYGAPVPQGYGAPGYAQPGYAQPHGGYHGHYRQHGGYHGHTHHKRRKGFLGELFD
jgi:Zn-finger nucleic acid-binding protein